MEDKNRKIVNLTLYLSEILSLLFFGINFYLYRVTGGILWGVFALFWAIDGIYDVAQDDDEFYDSFNK